MQPLDALILQTPAAAPKSAQNNNLPNCYLLSFRILCFLRWLLFQETTNNIHHENKLADGISKLFSPDANQH